MELAAVSSGPLDGLTFAIKDVFDVAGSRTGFGHPAWLASHPPAIRTASAVTKLLEAGATLIGRTVSDELCYSISGRNDHYGTPINPAAPDRLPGGSSSGSAVAVAAGLVDFAIGTDCGGSVRVPASHCGLFGFRPTHGRIPVDGVTPFAPRFDTVGWFARDAAVLQRVGSALLHDAVAEPGFRHVIVATDGFDRADPAVRQALDPYLQRVAAAVGRHSAATLSPDGLDSWLETFRIAQAGQVWASVGDWVSAERPAFGAGVGARLAVAAELSTDEIRAAHDRVDSIAADLADRILESDLLCLPTTPAAAPRLAEGPEDVEIDYRRRSMALLCAAGLGGLPQVTVPVAMVDGAPVGLSLVARSGKDMHLLSLVESVFADVRALRVE